jgi:hypothetical protein
MRCHRSCCCRHRLAEAIALLFVRRLAVGEGVALWSIKCGAVMQGRQGDAERRCRGPECLPVWLVCGCTRERTVYLSTIGTRD